MRALTRLGPPWFRVHESAAVRRAKASDRTTVIHVESGPLVYGPDGEGWWDVPVAGVSELTSTQAAHTEYVQRKTAQRPLLG
ncbi:hypothetical protein [Clavibacter michiganensis]|uniref:hypothetical protein n=1 Tax=Clavibacter michiganensis TaxID=28447 RepID=UPI0011C359BD|nr:hypothetical protein [Clavibacter michiganensis]